MTVQGITTDGSTLYPEPIAAVFGAVPHQVCQFHVLHEVNKAVLSAVAQERKRLAAGAPKLPRGRPSSKAAKRAAGRTKRIEQKVGELFAHRYLFVQRRLSPSERATLQGISRGLPQLRTLRGLMEEVYRLFDRQCRMATALAKLEQLRARLRRFGRLRKVLKKLLAPGLEKALVFLDERLLGATSKRWSVATVATARCRRRYTGFGRSGRSRAGWRWTCCGSSTPKAGPRRPRPCTRRGRRDARARYPGYTVEKTETIARLPGNLGSNPSAAALK